MRATTRLTGAAKQTVADLLVDIGQACSEYQDYTLRNLNCPVIECDEIWAYCYAKQKNVPDEYQGTFGYGDVWTWTAIDADTKLVPSWLVGERTNRDAYYFLSDLRSRLRNNRVQITTDGHQPYLTVIEPLFGADSVDYAQLIKVYESSQDETRYSPAQCTSTDIRVITGDPDPDRISTSYVERQNLTMRMGMRRFTRLTNAFSKKVENHAHTVSLHFMYYNFGRHHQSLRVRQPDGKYRQRTPAMAAGVSDYKWSLTDIAALLD